MSIAWNFAPREGQFIYVTEYGTIPISDEELNEVGVALTPRRGVPWKSKRTAILDDFVRLFCRDEWMEGRL